jgi:hypothetical protein
MPGSLRRSLVLFSLTGLLTSAAPAAAQQDWLAPPHVRPEADLRELFDEATARSPTVRGLVNWLETLDVTVYIRARTTLPAGLDGRLALLSVSGAHRYVVIELATGRSSISQISTLGHELRHAIEIANEPSIVNRQSFGAYYARVGKQTGDSDGRQTFETQEAAATGLRVRRELLAWSTRNSNGT